ncbi:MAG: putative 2OG-Fe(II) oxygenase [Rhodospirillaceae bacterium]
MAASTKIDIQPLFATPVAVAMLPDHERISAALRETILARAEAEPSTEHSNLGSWQSTWDMAEWGGEAAAYLLSFVRHMADTLTVDRHGKPAPQDWRSNAWANVNRSGHGNEFHTHPGCVWSAVYYVDDGGAVFGASESISPQPGSVLMFPSWVSHAVRPYAGDGTRISVAINLS